MIAKLLTEHHLEFLSLKGGCRASSKSTLVKMLEISCHCSFIHYYILYINLIHHIPDHVSQSDWLSDTMGPKKSTFSREWSYQMKGDED